MLGEAYRYQKQAADYFPDRYAAWLAMNPALDRKNFLGHLEEWRDFRGWALAYYATLLSKRDLARLPLLLYAYAPGGGAIRPALSVKDESKFLALYELAVANGAVVSPEMSVLARGVAAKGVKADTSIRDNWHGTVPSRPQESLVKDMFPNVDQPESFCQI
jgi:hypothetical protein